MDHREKVAWAAGTVLLSIGEGKFHDAMSQVVMAINHEAYERGKREGLKEALAKTRRREVRCRLKE